MKKFIIQAVLLVLVIGGSLFLFKYQEGTVLNLPFVPQTTKIAGVRINDTILTVEIADTQEKRSKGLAGRESIASNEGMLFIFDKPSQYAFWMKGLKVALDFIWIKDDAVVDFIENVPPPAIGQTDSALPVYSAKLDINKVLEVNAGTIKRLNIKVGDKIQMLNP